MNWIEITVETSREAEEAVCHLLREMGAEGTAIADPEVLARDWDDRYGEIAALSPGDYPSEGIRIQGYFPEATFDPGMPKRLENRVRDLASFGLDPGPGRVTHRQVSEESWAQAWKSYYKPVRVTSRLTVKPLWEEYQTNAGEIVIELDPGMAFGTGTHPTTSMSMALVEKYMKPGDRVIDVGCGSGILSIAAAKLGAERVLALDLDPLAVEKATENVVLNRVEAKVTVRQGDLLKGVKDKADLVVSNILAEIILRFTDDVPRVLAPRGTFIVSGIISGKRAEVIRAIRSAGLDVVETIHEGDWVALAARKW